MGMAGLLLLALLRLGLLVLFALFSLGGGFILIAGIGVVRLRRLVLHVRLRFGPLGLVFLRVFRLLLLLRRAVGAGRLDHAAGPGSPPHDLGRRTGREEGVT